MRLEDMGAMIFLKIIIIIINKLAEIPVAAGLNI